MTPFRGLDIPLRKQVFDNWRTNGFMLLKLAGDVKLTSYDGAIPL